MRRPSPHGKVSLGRVIATRQFKLRGKPNQLIELRIGTPKALDQDAYCPVQLVGVGDEAIKPIWGVDRFQALQLALRFVELLLLKHGERLRWEGQAAYASVQTDPWRLFSLSEFVEDFAALCLQHGARARPSRSKANERVRG